MRRFIIAVQFLTLFPIKKDLELREGELAGSMAFYPLAGALQGALLVAVWYALSPVLPPTVVAGLMVLLLALTNGGLHLDGFADTVDGLAGGRTPEERLRIMRDSSTGAIGAAFVFLLLLLKFLSVLEVPGGLKPQALFLFPVAGRWAMVPLAALSDYARKEGLGASFSRLNPSILIISTTIAAALVFIAAGLMFVAILAVLGITAYILSWFFAKRLGGVTGDVFGFHSEISEVVFLIAFLGLANGAG